MRPESNAVVCDISRTLHCVFYRRCDDLKPCIAVTLEWLRSLKHLSEEADSVFRSVQSKVRSSLLGGTTAERDG